ncbi:Serine/threonine-protein phosphatase 2B catalytic subunit [Pyrenochaeta sp. MPI-SDFR-AT-0127]|nr:Serine/threonine-protein phosphatase 2B catalytic subunit [Pyrenochaeta sp. MPI-SDFR-AT-0127]
MEETTDVNTVVPPIKKMRLPPKIDLTLSTLEDGTQVSTLDRICKDVQAPATERPTDKQFWLSSDHDKPNLPFLRDHFHRQGRLEEEQALWIIRTGTDILRCEDTLLTVKAPMTICGDIFGQYYDLMKILEVGGDPYETPYLFLGNYVNHGRFGIECILYLWSLKISYPQTFWLLRGNHECRHMTDSFTFKAECIHKYSKDVYEACMESFDCLPSAAVINEKLLCLHGGLSPELQTLDQLREIDRFCEIPTSGLMCDILWSDPMEAYGQETIADSFIPNEKRGISYSFAYQAVCEFLERNNLLSIIRGHEPQEQGYRLYRKPENAVFSSLMAVFSAPNYKDLYKNRAAMIKYENNAIDIKHFDCSPHPFCLPNSMDAFTWSLPFVAEKIVDMLLAILIICSRRREVDWKGDRKEGREEDLLLSAPVSAPIGYSANDPDSVEFKRRAIKYKTLAVARMSRAFSVLRQESEAVSSFKVPVGDRLSADTLVVGGEAPKDTVQTFEDAQKLDLVNERLPPSHQQILFNMEQEKMEALYRACEATSEDSQLGRRIAWC